MSISKKLHGKLITVFGVTALVSVILLFIITAAAKIFIMTITAAVFIVLTTVYIFKRGKWVLLAGSFVLALILSTLGSYISCNLRYGSVCESVETAGENASITAVVDKIISYNAYSFSCEVKIESINGVGILDTRAKLICSFAADMSVNERFSCIATLSPVKVSNDYFNGLYLLSKGMWIEAACDDTDIITEGEAGFSIRALFASLNDTLSGRLTFLSGKEAGSIASALLLGNTDVLSSGVKSDLRTLGLSHLIAVSGMHFSILAGGLYTLLKDLGIRMRLVIIASASVAFIFITGAPPSIIRCALMTGFSYAGIISRVKLSSGRSLLLATALIAIVDPFALFDVGLILSVLATYGIITFGGSFNTLLKIYYNARDGKSRVLVRSLLFIASSSLCVQLITLPASLLFFGSLSLMAPLANMIFVPLSTLILYTAPLTLLAGCIPVLSSVAGIPLKWECLLFGGLADSMANPSYSIPVNYNFTIPIIIVLAGMLIAVFIIKHYVIERSKKWSTLLYLIPFLLSAAIFGAMMYGYNAAESELTRFYYVNGGKRDYMVMTNRGVSYLFDISDGAYTILSDCADIAVSDHCRQIDYYTLTHYHRRHITSFMRLTDYIYVANVILPAPQSKKEVAIYDAILDIANENGCNVSVYPSDRLSMVSLGGENGVIFSAVEREYIGRSTHPVISVKVIFGGGSVFYAGGSVFESPVKGSAKNLANTSDILIFGAHSPIIKQLISTDFLKRKPYAVLYGNADVLTMIKDGKGKFADSFTGCCAKLDGVVKLTIKDRQYNEEKSISKWRA